MEESDLARLTATVLAASFGLGIAFGAISQRTHFCTMGAIADAYTMRDFSRLRMWVLAAGVAVLGFNGLVAAGWIDAADSIYARPRLMWLSDAAGGLAFGFGMVLASGCSSKMLVRIGGGSLKALVVFVVLGVAAYATLRGIVAVGRVASIDRVAFELAPGQDLPSLLAAATGWSRRAAAASIGGIVGVALLAWALARPEGRTRDTLLAGLGIGAVIVGAWWVTGRLGHVAEHPLTLEEAFIGSRTTGMEAMTFVAPVAYTIDWLILFSDTSKALTIGVVSVAGVIVGSALIALAGGGFRWEGFGGTEDTANHMVGAALMGVGGITAFGCTIGQGLSGISTLSLGSFIAVAGIGCGAWAALRYQSWRLERLA